MIWNFLIPHIKKLEDEGCLVECACSKTGFYFEELVNKYGLVLHEINFARNPFKIQNIQAYNELSILIKAGNFDVIYGHEPVGGAMARLAGKRNKKYVMYIAHGFHFFDKAPIKHWVLYYSFEFILSFFTDAIVTICKEDFKHAMKLHANRCYYIPGIGVDFSKYDKVDKKYQRETYRNKLGIADDEIVLISVGELSVRKNQKVILQAMNELNNSSIKLVLCGEGEQEEYLKQMCKELGLEKQVIFLGFCRDIPQVLCLADVFVFPSLWEGLGLAGIEAMYSGLPVIGSDRQGIKDYVIDQKTGYLFEPTDYKKLAECISNVINHSDFRINAGIEGKKLVEKYRLENSINELNKIYVNERIINGGLK